MSGSSLLLGGWKATQKFAGEGGRSSVRAWGLGTAFHCLLLPFSCSFTEAGREWPWCQKLTWKDENPTPIAGAEGGVDRLGSLGEDGANLGHDEK